jgi:hypothetical protein
MGELKKIAPSGWKRENFWGISCEKSRFYAKKSYFFQLRREARKLLGYFVLFSLISFYFVFISLISLRFVSLSLISFRFVSFLFRFALYRKNNRGLKEIKPIFTITMLDYFPHMSVFHQERTGFDHH